MSERCVWVTDRLPDYHAGRLGPGDRRELEAHLGECASCARESELIAALRGVPLPPPPQDRWDRLPDEVIQQARRSAVRAARTLRLLWAAAALALVAGASGIGWWFATSREATPSAEEISVVPEVEALAWTVSLPGGESAIPAGFTLEGLSAPELEILLEEVGDT